MVDLGLTGVMDLGLTMIDLWDTYLMMSSPMHTRTCWLCSLWFACIIVS